jgi:glucosamine--fructose-6-phosphate aminotransferase (isomerizing)
MSDALVVAISQSGRSPDIIAVVDEARRQDAQTVALTNDATSPLAAASDHVIDLRAGPELATAATKTYTAELLAAALLSTAIDPPTDHETSDLERLPGLLAEALATEDAVRQVAAGHADRKRCVVLGRGFSYASAREWALKLQETSQVAAMPYSAADFEHGPLALAEAGLQVLAVAPAGPELDAQLALLRRLHQAHGTHVLLLSDSVDARQLDEGLDLPADIPRWLGPIVEIVPAQLYTYHLTVARGLDPERPRTITKVTETR